MEPAVITIDGQIDLIDQQSPSHEDSSGVGRARLSRLNDVMIVLERERSAVEGDLTERLTGAVLTGGIESLTLNLDEQTPKFSIAIQLSSEIETARPITTAQRRALEMATTAEIVATIQKHASYAEKPRWQPNVTAVCRSAVPGTAKQARVTSIWLRTLFWLLAAVILGVGFLYLKQAPA